MFTSRLLQCLLTGWTDITDVSSEPPDSSVFTNRLERTHVSTELPVLTYWLDITDVSIETPDSSSVHSLVGDTLQM